MAMFSLKSLLIGTGLLVLTGFTQISAAKSSSTARILIYSATRDYRHDHIPVAIAQLKVKGPSINVKFDDTEDQSWFTDERLAVYDAVLFLDNSAEVLDDAGKAAFQKYLNLGGNFIGIHCATDALRDTEFFGREIGARFEAHPPIQKSTVIVLDPTHPSTRMLPSRWEVVDEMYNFKSDPRDVGAVVILAADESSYSDLEPRAYDHGTPHPLAWYQERGAGVASGGIAGRSFYTALGHLNESWADDLFMAHVTGGITWTLGSNTTKAFNPTAEVGNPRTSSLFGVSRGTAAVLTASVMIAGAGVVFKFW